MIPPPPQPLRLFDPGFFDDPYPTYASLRSTAPVFWDDRLGAWVLTRYDDVATALSDPRLSREGKRNERFFEHLDEIGEGHLRPVHRLLSAMMLFADPPRHTRLRALVHQAFTPRLMASMRPYVQAIVDGLLDEVRPSGRMDVIRDLAEPLPLIVIGELLGLPAEDRVQFARWSQDIIDFSAGATAEDQGRRALRSTLEATAYLRVILSRCRADPGDDLLSGLAVAKEADASLSEDEILATAVLLLMNGHETVTMMIGNGLLALLSHPGEMRRLLEEPRRDDLLVGAVEELLRYDGSVQLRGLAAKEDLDIGGKTIRRGHGVYAVMGAANRDPARFPRPDTLDLDRRDGRHLEFGHGVHHCIGAALARLELQVALSTMLARLPELALATERVIWRTVPVFRGPTALPVRFGSR